MRFHTRILFAMIVTGGALLLGTARLDAQEVRYGFAAGLSFAEGLKAPAPVQGPFLLAGAVDPGYHLRGSLELPLGGSRFALATEVLFNRLTSRPSSYTFVSEGEPGVRAALEDESLGLAAKLVGSLAPRAEVEPFLSAGPAFFYQVLGTNPDPDSDAVRETRVVRGLGLSLGGGLRIDLGRADLLLEAVAYQSFHQQRGSGFLPVTVGLVF